MHGEDCGSLLNSVSLPLINKSLLYSIVGCCGNLSYSNTSGQNGSNVQPLHSRIQWEMFTWLTAFKVLLRRTCRSIDVAQYSLQSQLVPTKVSGTRNHHQKFSQHSSLGTGSFTVFKEKKHCDPMHTHACTLVPVETASLKAHRPFPFHGGSRKGRSQELVPQRSSRHRAKTFITAGEEITLFCY